MLQDSVSLAEVRNSIPVWIFPDYFDRLKKTVFPNSFFFLPGVCMFTVTLETVEQFQALRQKVVARKIRGSFTFNENRQAIQGETDH